MNQQEDELCGAHNLPRALIRRRDDMDWEVKGPETQGVTKLTGWTEIRLVDGDQPIEEIISMINYRDKLIVATAKGVYIVYQKKKWWEFWK